MRTLDRVATVINGVTQANAVRPGSRGNQRAAAAVLGIMNRHCLRAPGLAAASAPVLGLGARACGRVRRTACRVRQRPAARPAPPRAGRAAPRRAPPARRPGRVRAGQGPASQQPFLSAVQFVSASTGWVVGSDRILHTADGGRHWDIQYRTAPAAQLTAVDFTDASHGWVVGASTVLVTTDAGAHWRPLAEPCRVIRAVHFFSPADGFAVAGGSVSGPGGAARRRDPAENGRRRPDLEPGHRSGRRPDGLLQRPAARLARRGRQHLRHRRRRPDLDAGRPRAGQPRRPAAGLRRGRMRGPGRGLGRAERPGRGPESHAADRLSHLRPDLAADLRRAVHRQPEPATPGAGRLTRGLPGSVQRRQPGRGGVRRLLRAVLAARDPAAAGHGPDGPRRARRHDAAPPRAGRQAGGRRPARRS